MMADNQWWPRDTETHQMHADVDVERDEMIAY